MEKYLIEHIGTELIGYPGVENIDGLFSAGEEEDYS